jgi:DNA-binding PadR family transcriptional regulator
MGPVASLLAMDRTTLTAALKPLENRGLVKISQDPSDRRSRILKLTAKGHDLLIRAVPTWERTHREIEQLIPNGDPDELRKSLRALSGIGRKFGLLQRNAASSKENRIGSDFSMKNLFEAARVEAVKHHRSFKEVLRTLTFRKTGFDRRLGHRSREQEYRGDGDTLRADPGGDTNGSTSGIARHSPLACC